MKRVSYLFIVALAIGGCISCGSEEQDLIAHEQNPELVSSDENNDLSAADEQNLALRAVALGYPDAATYVASVAVQCAAGNHENCDIMIDGIHHACINAEHCGINHNSSYHNGNDHHGAVCDPNTCTNANHIHNAICDPATCMDRNHNHGANRPNAGNHGGGGYGGGGNHGGYHGGNHH